MSHHNIGTHLLDATQPIFNSERFIDIHNGIDKKYHIAPATSSFFSHLTEWGKQLNEPPFVIYLMLRVDAISPVCRAEHRSFCREQPVRGAGRPHVSRGAGAPSADPRQKRGAQEASGNRVAFS